MVHKQLLQIDTEKSYPTGHGLDLQQIKNYVSVCVCVCVCWGRGLFSSLAAVISYTLGSWERKASWSFLGINRDHRFSILVGVESNQLTAQMIKLWTREVNQNKCGQPAG